jgi:UDP-N-acetylglucosamine enolpyruvyl transferase
METQIHTVAANNNMAWSLAKTYENDRIFYINELQKLGAEIRVMTRVRCAYKQIRAKELEVLRIHRVLDAIQMQIAILGVKQ